MQLFLCQDFPGFSLSHFFLQRFSRATTWREPANWQFCATNISGSLLTPISHDTSCKTWSHGSLLSMEFPATKILSGADAVNRGDCCQVDFEQTKVFTSGTNFFQLQCWQDLESQLGFPLARHLRGWAGSPSALACFGCCQGGGRAATACDA